MGALTIGALADAAGVGIETVRFYERKGLLPAPPRSPSGYRQYSDVDVWRLDLIARGKALGFTLAEIAALLGDGSGTEARSAAEVRDAARAKIRAVDEQARTLAEVRERLVRLVATCDQGDDEGCASLEGERMGPATWVGGDAEERARPSEQRATARSAPSARPATRPW